MKALYSIIALLSISLFAKAQPDIPSPNAPDVTVEWQEDGMHISLSNTNVLSNNFQETYAAVDANILDGDSIWYFQGYKIYQVQIPMDFFDPSNTDIARLVAQTDVADDIDDLYNSVYDPNLGECVTIVEVQGSNGGIASDFVISSEMWTGEFVPGEIYCYVAVAYVANANGVNAECPEMPYQYYPGVGSAEGGMLIQCASVPEPTTVTEQSAFSVDVFPNPIKDVMHWKSNEKISAARILSVVGEELIAIEGVEINSLDLSELPSGVFLVELISQENRSVQRIVKE